MTGCRNGKRCAGCLSPSSAGRWRIRSFAGSWSKQTAFNAPLHPWGEHDQGKLGGDVAVQAYLKALQVMLNLPPDAVSGKLLFVAIDRLVTIAPGA